MTSAELTQDLQQFEYLSVVTDYVERMLKAHGDGKLSGDRLDGALRVSKAMQGLMMNYQDMKYTNKHYEELVRQLEIKAIKDKKVIEDLQKELDEVKKSLAQWLEEK